MDAVRIVVYTLTRDRLELTRRCLPLLHEKAGHRFAHVVLDNGSTDGTVEWLRSKYTMFSNIVYEMENVGIARACNHLKEIVLSHSPDLVIKMDNDCEVLSDEILKSISMLYEHMVDSRPFTKFRSLPVLSPHVSGCRTRVKRIGAVETGGFRIGWTQIVGGLFHVVPVAVYKEYCHDETLPKAWGNDGHFCKWLRERGTAIGYIEDLHVAHYLTTDGQERMFPEYFERKKLEEQLA